MDQVIADYSALFSVEDFARWQSGEYQQAERIRYSSDGLEINGFVVRPRQPGRYPLVIYNHGGVMQWGRIILPEMLEFHRLAERGYVVMASYFRGEGGSEDQPDMGGGDVRDTRLALIDSNMTLAYRAVRNRGFPSTACSLPGEKE